MLQTVELNMQCVNCEEDKKTYFRLSKDLKAIEIDPQTPPGVYQIKLVLIDDYELNPKSKTYIFSVYIEEKEVIEDDPEI